MSPPFLLLLIFSAAAALPYRHNIKEHCGPRDIPSSHSRRIAEQLAREFLPSAEYVYNEISGGRSKLSREGIRQWMNIGSAVRELSEAERIAHFAAITAEMMESTVDHVTKFTASYEVHRIERWAKDLLLIGLNARHLIPKLMDLPFENGSRWIESSSRRFDIILDAILIELCPLEV